MRWKQLLGRQASGRLGVGFLVLSCCLTGCTALTNPVAEGIPVRRLSPELLAKPKDSEETLPLNLLGQAPPDIYRLAPGDALGINLDDILASKDFPRYQPAPIQVAPPYQTGEQRKFSAAWGYPVIVQEDGTIVLPMLPPIKVQGLSITEAREAISKAYEKNEVFQKAYAERVQVTLLQARQYNVVVMREEAGGFTAGAAGPSGIIATSKRGTGHNFSLPAYENDVLHALSLSGGLPGLDVFNEILIYRAKAGMSGPEVTRIPLHFHCGDIIPNLAEEVILQSGDIVFLKPRDRDLFFTAGLLPSGEFVLPRDHDLDVIQAIAQVRGPFLNAAFSPNNLAGNLIAPGIGNPSPSLLTVLRETPDGRQVAIRVDLNRALQDRRERILVKAGDVLILQETPGEALARYTTQTLLNFSLAWQLIHSPFANGVVDVSAPQQIPARIGVSTVGAN